MSKEITTAFKAMQTDITISMDDVVSAFVSQYENNLYDRKKELTGSINAVELQVTALHAAVRQKVTSDSFVAVLPYDLMVEIDEGVVNWKEKRVDFGIKISLKSGGNRYGNTIDFKKNKPIPAALINTNTKLVLELSELRAALTEVLVSLKSVARKERQVRGRIAVRKLEDSGYANLLDDSELALLVQLDD